MFVAERSRTIIVKLEWEIAESVEFKCIPCERVASVLMLVVEIVECCGNEKGVERRARQVYLYRLTSDKNSPYVMREYSTER
jgi:hypothetical protein